jgi:hypothetical protein
MDLPFLVLHAFRAAGHPLPRQRAGTDISPVRLRQLRPGKLHGTGGNKRCKNEKSAGPHHVSRLAMA